MKKVPSPKTSLTTQTHWSMTRCSGRGEGSRMSVGSRVWFSGKYPTHALKPPTHPCVHWVGLRGLGVSPVPLCFHSKLPERCSRRGRRLFQPVFTDAVLSYLYLWAAWCWLTNTAAGRDADCGVRCAVCGAWRVEGGSVRGRTCVCTAQRELGGQRLERSTTLYHVVGFLGLQEESVAGFVKLAPVNANRGQLGVLCKWVKFCQKPVTHQEKNDSARQTD